jgi:HK97 family phage major capsid protein
MSKKYIRTDTGVLILATQEQIADEKIEKFEVEERSSVPQDDPIKELTGIVREMATSLSTIKEKADQQEAALAAYKNAVDRGFLPPNPREGPTAASASPELKEIMGHYELAFQGKELMSKTVHPNHTIDDATRIELAKFYALFLRHTLFQDWRAKDQFWKIYGSQMKTAIGDVGNAFPLPDIVDSEILAFAREASVVLQYARIWSMSSDKQSFPAENAAAAVAWGNNTSQSDPGITEVQLDANELSAYTVVKNATLMDARSDIVSWLTSALAEAAGQELDNQAFNGTGSPFFGILDATGASYSVTLGGSSFSDLTFTDLSSMIAKLDGLRKQGARFWMHGQGLHLIRTLKDDQNRPIFYDTIGSPTAGTILGFPYSEVIKMPSTTGASTAFMVFGNLRYFGIGRRLEVSTLSADPYGLWTTNRMRYKLYQRWGMKISLANGFVRMLTSS